MKYELAVLNLRGLDAAGLANKGQNVCDGVNANSSSFPSAMPFIGILQMNVTALNTAITAAGNDPTKVQTSAIRDAEKQLRRSMRLVCALVNWDGNGDATKLLSSGFDLKSNNPPSAKSFVAKLGKLSGTVELEINSYGNAAYTWEQSPDPIAAWSQCALTTLSKASISGLTPGQKYWFRVKVTKGSNLITTSDPYTIMVV